MQPQVSADPPRFSQCLYGKYLKEVAKLKISIDLKLCWDQEAEPGGGKWHFSQLHQQTSSIPDLYSE